jgi:CubicO group peptidase (beta-lactamase class C family)
MAHPKATPNQDISSISWANNTDPANRHHGLRYFSEYCYAVANISRGEAPVHALELRPEADLSSVSIDYLGGTYALETFLEATETMGFVVLKAGEIVFERMPGLERRDRPTIMSVSKLSIMCLLGPLVEAGEIDLQKTVAHYLPEMGSGYANATLQDVVDMNVPSHFNEDYQDPKNDMLPAEVALAWRPDPANHWPWGGEQYLRAIRGDEVRGNGVTDYKSVNTDIMGLLIEAVTGHRLADLLSEQIWQHLGAEQNALMSLDKGGLATPGGGMMVSLHDLARWGLLFAQRGIAPDGTRVLSEAWIDACMSRSGGTHCPIGTGYRYHNQTMSNGRSIVHTGWCGQFLYTDTVSNIVVAKLSAITEPSGFQLELGTAYLDMGDAIVNALS